ncbi:MAG: hypothetical protein M1821_007686 [Bathelium mastoideum]|nr:MAG: hypothetical protein M1821_007686 [Bathelium mastoideum]
MAVLCENVGQFSTDVKGTFDYIICGGGTAGLVVAARLTEDPNVTVGLLEAGQNRMEDPLVNTPAAAMQMLSQPDYDWMVESIPQAISQKGNLNRIHAVPRGKMLGGSSALNWTLYTRGSDIDFENWAALTGDESWSADNFRAYFRKHQTLDPIGTSISKEDKEFMPFQREFHGEKGPIHTSFDNWHLPFGTEFLRACHNTARREAMPLDPWSGDHLGFYSTLATVNSSMGTRSYAASAYLQPNLDRSNLKVLTGATVSKVILDQKGSTSTARAVKFLQGGEQHVVQANKEVIVSCGVVQSPQILELSGIGDPDILRQADVSCLVDLPSVGENLQDHPGTMISWTLSPNTKTMDQLADPAALAAAQEEYASTHSGILTSVTSSMGFLPYRELVSETELQHTIDIIHGLPNKTPFQAQQREQVINLLQSPKHAGVHFVMCPATFNLSEEAVKDQKNLVSPPVSQEAHGAGASICVSNSVGRGSVHIQSADPLVQPTYDQAFFENEADVAIATAGLRFLDRVANGELKDKIKARVYPPSEVILDDDKQANDYVHSLCISEYHPVGTCAMSQVVDGRLRVRLEGCGCQCFSKSRERESHECGVCIG